MNGLHTSSAARLAWLLLRLRIHSGERRLQQRKEFADGLVSLGVNADPSRVSRWESGTNSVPERVLFGYEALLGYPAGHLTSIAHNLRSSLDPQVGPGLLLITGVPETQPELDELFATLESGRSDGQNWTLLASSIMAGTYMYLPERLWTELTERLLSETVRSVRIAHIRRLAASGVIAHHPPAQRVMIRSIGRLVTAPGTRFVAPALMLLRDVVSPEVDALLMQMIQAPRGQVRRGTAATIASKLARGHLDTATIDQLQALMPALLMQRVGQNFPTDIVDAFAALKPARQEAVFREIDNKVATRTLRESLASGLVVPVDRSHRLASTIARRATAMLTTPGNSGEADFMLVRLIEESLFHLHRERRYQAALLLGVSPVAEVLPTAIMRSLDTNDRYSVSRCLSLIAFLRPNPEIAGQLLQYVLHSTNNWLRCRAMTALVPLGPHIGEAAQNEIASMISRSDDPEVLHTGLHLLGTMSAPAIDRLVDHDPEARPTAHWWLDSGPLIDEDPAPRP